jgi:hypothetical protein
MADLKHDEHTKEFEYSGDVTPTVNHNAEQLQREDLRRLASTPLPPALQGMTPDELAALEVKMRRKIDLRLLPMIVLMYIMNYLDRNNISSAKLAGLSKELKLVGDQFQVKTSLSGGSCPCSLLSN